jgi:hypothetical protein
MGTGSDYEKNIRAIAICAKCRKTEFELRIFSCGNAVPYCLGCNEAWDIPDFCRAPVHTGDGDVQSGVSGVSGAAETGNGAEGALSSAEGG